MFARLKQWLVAFWRGPAGGIIEEAASAFIRALGEIAAQILLMEAQSLVAKLELRSDINGATKSSIAKSTLATFVRDRGIPAGTLLIEKAITDSLLALRSSRGA